MMVRCMSYRLLLVLLSLQKYNRTDSMIYRYFLFILDHFLEVVCLIFVTA
jgi:hypothetical protein